ncbi:MAG: DEAD/DEAH box helicase [Gemmatimonadota bacterium]|nr:DEAD/DEAH box helicase [Gemmatimonadota bacterium]
MMLRRVTSRWGRPIAERWLATWAHDPVLVAESLRRLPDPLEPILGGIPPTPAPAVLAAMARALRPIMADDVPPPWLREEQVPAFRRALAVLRQYGGGVLAEAVGTGKTWIALAATQALGAEPLVVLAPAAVVGQWEATATQLGVKALIHSHETISRGRLPAVTAGVVIIDESHWYREPTTRRYRTLAPWLTGSRCLLVTATPVVNDAADLGHQLRLCLRDDALSPAGLPSLRRLTSASAGLEALAEVVVSGFVAGTGRPDLRQTSTRLRPDPRLSEVLRELDRLGLSTDPGVAALVRTSLWGAAASSPAALSAALLRYQALLDHAEDAARSGQQLGREALRRFIAADPSQLVLWELLPAGESTGDLVLDDRESLTRIRAVVARWAEKPDRKVAALRALIGSNRRTLVFAGSVATVGYLWRHLGPGPVAWCTGTRAGIGATVLPREAVLAWFAPHSSPRSPAGLATPSILVTTDVAAEGLDLQGAEQVVHYDIPWTSVRTDQRTGRVHRMGSPHRAVQAHWLLPARELAVRLGVERSISRKRQIPRRLGIGESATAWWRLRQDARHFLPIGGEQEGCGLVAVEAGAAGGNDAVACVRIELAPGRGATRLLVHGPAHGWRHDEPRALQLLHVMAQSPGSEAPSDHLVQGLVEELAEPVRAALRAATGREWDPAVISPGTARLLQRLRHWARIAARARDARLLEQLDHAIRALGRGLTAGEEIRLARLAARDDATLHEHLAALPRTGPLLSIPRVRLVALLVIQPSAGGGEEQAGEVARFGE